MDSTSRAERDHAVPNGHLNPLPLIPTLQRSRLGSHGDRGNQNIPFPTSDFLDIKHIP